MVSGKSTANYAIGNLLANTGKVYATGSAITVGFQLVPLFLWFGLTGTITSVNMLQIFIKRIIMTVVPNPNYLYLNPFLNLLVGILVWSFRWKEGMQRRGYSG